MKMHHKAKVITVFGGVYSSLGKGVTISSIAKILSCLGYKVSILKFDPYLNYDTGMMAPGQHGETFVTADGAQADLDLGTYERFLDRELTELSTMTTGKIFWSIINKERSGGYDGKTVQIVPHVTEVIKNRINEIIRAEECDFLLIELGGTTGDIESSPYIEAISQFNIEYGSQYCLNCLVAPLISLSSTSGEYKTKPAQHAIKMLRSLGINPKMLILRTSFDVEQDIYEKMYLTSHIDPKAIFVARDMKSVYELPDYFYQQKVHEFILNYFHLKYDKKTDKFNTEWQSFVNKTKKIKHEIQIALIGKYISLHDSYASVIEALRFAGYQHQVKVKIKWIESDQLGSEKEIKEQLKDCSGAIVPGGFGVRGMKNMINTLKYLRENNIPTIGLCLGMQLMVIEFARNVLNQKEAHSTEFDQYTPFPVIQMLDSKLRLGNQECQILKGSKAHELYQTDVINQRHRHRYGLIDEEHIKLYEVSDFIPSMFGTFAGNKKVVEFMEHKKNKCYMGCQFHPEFVSKPQKPDPIFSQLIMHAKNNH